MLNLLVRKVTAKALKG